MAKFCSRSQLLPKGTDRLVADACRIAVAVAAAAMVSTAMDTAAAAGAGAQGCCAVQLLPSLVLFGRCCLQWADELQVVVPAMVQVMNQMLTSRSSSSSAVSVSVSDHMFAVDSPIAPLPAELMSISAYGALQVCFIPYSFKDSTCCSLASGAAAAEACGLNLVDLLQHFSSWLLLVQGRQAAEEEAKGGGSSGSGSRGSSTSNSGKTIAAQLALAGYDAENLLKLSRELLASLMQMRDPPASQSLAAEQQLMRTATQQLQALGAACCNNLAVPCFCNNPRCTSISSDTTELSMVSGRSCVCSGCRTSRYCCAKPCQTRHWKAHKPVCQALAAAAKHQQQQH